MTQTPDNAAHEEDLPEQLRIRHEKRAAIIARGQEPYPVSVPRTASLKAIRETHKDLEID
ncbi:MAG: lysine--tRNA ligase, partial [Actinobacteria bacterium]|nr:lysine--tRNA ligase [Actinomycetota bacterium]